MLLDILRQRYSCRRFSSKPVPQATVDYMLQCARLSASGGNEQPWMFGVVMDPELIRGIAQAAGVNYRQAWIETAPLVVVLCTKDLYTKESVYGMRRFPSKHDRLQAIDKDLLAVIDMEEHQTKIPGEHMVLAALEHGVYSTWISSMDCERVEELLNVRGYFVTNAIAFGYPEGEPKIREKKPLSEIVFWNRFPDGTAD
ncbi:MAG TPA: nitroreductase family protein [Clostridia bacterium]|nr:nitroreductase family protein [Clostridia bacterium]